MGTVTCSCGGFSLVQHGKLTAQLLGKESRVPSVPTAPESQGSCSEGATAPSAPPQLAFHLSQAPCTHHPPHPFPSTPLLGACWALAACGAAEQQQQMRHGPEKRDAPPRPPSAREEAEMLQSSGDQRDHGRAANPPTAPGPLQLTPVLRGAWVPPLCDGCETPLSPLLLRPWPCHPVGFWGAAGRG